MITPLRRPLRTPLKRNLLSQGVIDSALVNLDERGILSTAGVIDEWTSSGTGGSAFDLDVPLGTQANLKPHDSGSALFYGASGDFISTPNSVAASQTGSIVLFASLRADDNTPATDVGIISKYTTTGDQRSYRLFVNNTPTGRATMVISTDGTFEAANEAISTAPVGIADGTDYWLFGVCDFSTPDITFHISLASRDATPAQAFADDSTFQLGDPVSITGTSIFDGTAPINISGINSGTAELFNGSVYKSGVIPGIDPTATPAVSFDARDGANKTGIASDTFVSSETGETYTMAGNTFIQNTGHLGFRTIGGAALETTAGQDMVPPLTLFFVVQFNDPTPAADQFVFDARSDAAKSVRVFTDFSNSNRLTLDCGGTPIVLTATYSTDIQLITVRHNGDATTSITSSILGTISGDAGTETLDFVTIAADLAGANTSAELMMAGLGYDEGLTDSQVLEAQARLIQKFRL